MARSRLTGRQSRRRLATLRRAIYHNDDRADYATARALLDGAFPWLEENIVSTWKDQPTRS